MTSTIFAQANPTGVAGYTTASESGDSYGLFFTVAQAGTLQAIWFYSPAGATVLPASVALYSTTTGSPGTGTLITQNSSPSWSGAAGSGWVRTAVAGTALSAGTIYVAQYYAASSVLQGFLYTASAPSAWFPSTSADGNITAPEFIGSTANCNGPFLNGANAYPSSVLSANVNWLADVEVRFSSAPPAPIPPRIPHPLWFDLLEVAEQRADWATQGVADLSVAFSSSSGGIDTYNVTSPWNGTTTQQMRVLKPTAPNGNYPHAFLIMLPVDGNQDTTFGDSIGTAQSISAQNNYNLTCVQPGYAPVGGGAVGPWFADNPLNPAISQEKYTLLVVNWIQRNLATTGTEKIYLIGFSRSGLGGQFLQFRHPGLFAAVASWDAPFMMTDYNGTDPTNGGAVGGNPDVIYGTSSNFTTHYELPTQLAGWQATGQYGVNRLWLGLGPAFPADTPAYDAALTAAGIPHTYTFSNTVEAHAWQTDWVAAALASIIPSNYTEAPTPPRIPHPLWFDLLEIAAAKIDNDPPPVVSVPGAAALGGAGSLTTGPSLGAPTSLGGAGSITGPDVTQGVTAGLGAAGSVSTAETLGVIATLAGAASLSSLATQGAPTSLAGTASLSSLATQGAPAALGAAGSVSTAVTLGVVAILAAAGSITGITGQSSQLLGTGSITGPDLSVGVITTLAAAGSLTSLVTQRAITTLGAVGSIVASGGSGGLTEGGPFNIILPGAWARVTSGTFTQVLPGPHMSLTGFPGTLSTLAAVLPKPVAGWTGTVRHNPFTVKLPALHTSLTGKVIHNPFNIKLPAPHTGLTGLRARAGPFTIQLGRARGSSQNVVYRRPVDALPPPAPEQPRGKAGSAKAAVGKTGTGSGQVS